MGSWPGQVGQRPEWATLITLIEICPRQNKYLWVAWWNMTLTREKTKPLRLPETKTKGIQEKEWQSRLILQCKGHVPFYTIHAINLKEKNVRAWPPYMLLLLSSREVRRTHGAAGSSASPQTLGKWGSSSSWNSLSGTWSTRNSPGVSQQGFTKSSLIS